MGSDPDGNRGTVQWCFRFEQIPRMYQRTLRRDSVDERLHFFSFSFPPTISGSYSVFLAPRAAPWSRLNGNNDAS